MKITINMVTYPYFNIYSYKGIVNIIVNGEKMSLHDELINNKITIDEIIEKVKDLYNKLL